MPLISGRAIPCPPEAEPAMPAITATASAAPIKGSPGKCVTQSTTCLNAGKVCTAVPKPTTEQVEPRAIRPLLKPCPNGVQIDLRQGQRQRIATTTPQKIANVGSSGKNFRSSPKDSHLSAKRVDN